MLFFVASTKGLIKNYSKSKIRFLGHELLHYSHLIKDPVRFSLEYSSYKHVGYGLSDIRWCYPFVGLKGDQYRSDASAYPWSSSNSTKANFEELRTVIGAPWENFHARLPIRYSYYQLGDNISENTFAKDLNLPN